MRSRRLHLCAVAALALAFSLAGAAQAKAPIPTTVTIDASPNLGDGFYAIIGKVTSPNQRCVGGRTIGIFAVFPDNSTSLVDIATTGKRGHYGGGGNFDEAEGVIAKVIPKRFGPRKHRRRCGAAIAGLS